MIGSIPSALRREKTDDRKGEIYFSSTDTGEWTIKGFIHIYKNIYTLSPDTKIMPKILEIHIFPEILRFVESAPKRISRFNFAK